MKLKCPKCKGKIELVVDMDKIDSALFNVNRQYHWGHRDLYDGQFRRKLAQSIADNIKGIIKVKK